MINAIRDVGTYLQENSNIGEIDIIRSLSNKIEGETIKEILLVDVKESELEVRLEEFYGEITTKALFYQAGNGVLGGAIRVDYFKDTDEDKEKFNNKIKKACAYCEIEDKFEAVKDAIYNKIRNSGMNFIAVILIDGKYPCELFKVKFLNKMYNTMFNGIPGKHVCHCCGQKDEAFNTTTYKFYTNDKEVYGNVNERDKSGVLVCKTCLNNILIGKQYVEKTLTTYWIGKSVMFLPHNFNEVTSSIYENSVIGSDEKKNFISAIYQDEEIVLEMLGKGNTETDIIFFEKDGSKTFYIYHTIKSMLPSRFGALAVLLNKYSIKLYNVIKFTTAIKVGLKGIETTDKEKLKIIEAVFKGKKIERKLFFTRAMMVYKYSYINRESTKNDYKFMVSNIGKVYNFLVDAKCLEGGFNIMTQYSDYTQLFEENKEYFDSKEKKAWFLMGIAYNYTNYMIKKSNSTEDGKSADRSSLDKNFFFARRFDFKDFIYFSNLLSDKMIKYRINYLKLKDILTEGKELMANREGKLSADEAKYLFFWGMDTYFKKDKEIVAGENQEVIEEKIIK